MMFLLVVAFSGWTHERIPEATTAALTMPTRSGMVKAHPGPRVALRARSISRANVASAPAYGPSWPKHTTLVVVELVAEHVLPPERRVAAPLLALRTVPR